MRKYFIVDDDENSITIIRGLMDTQFPEWKFVGEATSSDSAIKKIESLIPDLVFIDVKIDMKKGFDILKSTSHMDYLAIMVTTYEDFSLKAFEYNTSGHILKPIDPAEFKNAVIKTQKLLSDPIPELYFKSLENAIKWHNNEGIFLTKKADIIRIESEGNYSFIHAINFERITISKYMKDIEQLLGGSPFLRVHNSHIVNLIHLKMFKKEDGGVIIMSDGSKVPVSRRKKEMLMELLN